jgi:hypothetical protein
VAKEAHGGDVEDAVREAIGDVREVDAKERQIEMDGGARRRWARRVVAITIAPTTLFAPLMRRQSDFSYGESPMIFVAMSALDSALNAWVSATRIVRSLRSTTR